ncbi:piggyBac transposable element-derived protein 4 isoform X2 [Cryptotermes secundus]|uniref:piggyBac transposable element-derived protein 4 isoform X2 n=1 Tax=Cryptotermes secundus TaxID=105785 RepID=UPI000CD7B7B0|nr:piggyBac transposable element-derived protein 4 isoform X2 [Cryptotermes secundus]
MKGKIIFKTYDPKKPTKCGIRLFVLVDSDTGYVHSIIPYYGKLTGDVYNLPYSEKPLTSRIVLSLMDKLGLSVSGVEGYHLFTDRYYSSVKLAQELDNQKCHTTGTIIADRVGNPKPVRQGAMKKMKSGDTCSYRSRNVLLMGWKDKRVVLMMSTYHDTSMEKIVTIQKGGQQKEIQKPVCVLDYAKHVGGINRSDHYCATYAFIRKSLKWWRKLFFWCLEVCIVNSYILYSSHKTHMGVKLMSHVRY